MKELLPKLTLVLGGASSGKSAYAESLITRAARPRIYIATAQAFDTEMKRKIADHQEMRGPDWKTIEAPTDIPNALSQAKEGDVVLIDCATLWLTNLILAEADTAEKISDLLNALGNARCPIIIVSNELGQGIVPENTLSRKFRNAHGRMNQDIAAQADTVVAVMAGLPLALKGTLA